MKLNSLQELYVEQLQDLYSAEKQLVKALPKMVKAASDTELQQAFQNHLAQTQGHVTRLERIFNQFGTSPGGKTCKAMEGLIEEGSEMLKKKGEPAVLDAGMIAAAQRIEHYEIAGYGCARTYASELGRTDDARLLEETLNEEKQADEKLTAIAEQSINVEAM